MIDLQDLDKIDFNSIADMFKDFTPGNRVLVDKATYDSLVERAKTNLNELAQDDLSRLPQTNLLLDVINKIGVKP